MVFVGFDVGTSSSKLVAVSDDGQVIAQINRSHNTSTPRPGWYEHDPDTVWWGDFVSSLAELSNQLSLNYVRALAISGIGPCVLVTDAAGRPLRPAILYGIDTRARAEIEYLSKLLEQQNDNLQHCPNRITTQSVGPKLLWIAHNEPEVWQQAHYWFSASNFLVFRLTGRYIVDHYTASASEPLYDLFMQQWWDYGWELCGAHILKPELAWPGQIIGAISEKAARETGLRPGVPVLVGTIDAMAEAYSVGVQRPGDVMLMYGSTMFIIQVVERPVVHPGLWAVAGLQPSVFSVAAGMATSGLITTWFAAITSSSLDDLILEAQAVPAGSDGLVLLPYFSGERTPLFDPTARGCWFGLTLQHTRGHLYRSILEGIAYGVRHNLETMLEAGALPQRLVAVGGGTRGKLWTQIVSDVLGMPQELPRITVGAAYGDAKMAAEACGINTTNWNPPADIVHPSLSLKVIYGELYEVYRALYPALQDKMARIASLPSRSRTKRDG